MRISRGKRTKNNVLVRVKKGWVSIITIVMKVCLGMTCMYVDQVAQDFTSSLGFAVAVGLVARLKSKGLLFAAPICSSWIWLSRSQTRRSRAFPMGRSNVACVKMGNLIMIRTILLARLAAALNCCWIIEQPRSSIAYTIERFQSLIADLGCWCCEFSLKDFGSKTPKPVVFQP